MNTLDIFLLLISGIQKEWIWRVEVICNISIENICIERSLFHINKINKDNDLNDHYVILKYSMSQTQNWHRRDWLLKQWLQISTLCCSSGHIPSASVSMLQQQISGWIVFIQPQDCEPIRCLLKEMSRQRNIRISYFGFIHRGRNNPRKHTITENGGDKSIQRAEVKDIFCEKKVLLNETNKWVITLWCLVKFMWTWST